MKEPLPEPERLPDPSRREFLTKTAAALGASSFVGACAAPSFMTSVREAKRRTALGEGETIRMGVIGTGGMGTGHTHAFIDINKEGREKVEIVALADVCKPRLDAAHEHCSQNQEVTVDAYSDYRDLLARDDIHGVLIASPEHWHADHAIDSILSGKDVYLEKPMTLNLDDAMRLRKVLEANPQMILQVGTQKIMLPKYVKAMELIADNAIGHPTFSQTSYCRNSKDGEWLYYDIDPEVTPGPMLDWKAWCGQFGEQPFNTEIYHRWRRYKKYSTGIIGDLLVHEMTPLVMAIDAGWPTRVDAIGGHYIDKAMENFDQVNLTIQFEKDHSMIVAGSTCNDIGLETMVRGHEATMYLGSSNVLITPQRDYVDEREEMTVECDSIGNDHDALRVNWLDCIRTREQPLANVELSTKIMVIVDLAARSMWEGDAFHFDPEKMRAVRA